MDSHDPKRIATGRGRQNWRAFRPVMHLHENHYTKRAGVAGIRARAGVIVLCKLILAIDVIVNLMMEKVSTYV
ncbi:TPA: hypothetical protein MIG64_22870 [Klebsiella pneumoniae]|nr:hypothetical protein [Klebsiella pneumoniae]HBX7839614.1 hypothetical protein [Klebsiella pneumoniae]HBY1563969.1 hypothetical protein [Klebsiella pneumoniae]HBY7765254.1 hypothetical protein [Klebsiella pneumoniae]HBY8076916.1 hypothetical protein [Klebsiella pneumoniae]